jgi:hypothetical protein
MSKSSNQQKLQCLNDWQRSFERESKHLKKIRERKAARQLQEEDEDEE